MENLHKSGGRGCPVSLGGSPSVSSRICGHAPDKSRLCPFVRVECLIGMSDEFHGIIWNVMSDLIVVFAVMQDILRASGGGVA